VTGDSDRRLAVLELPEPRDWARRGLRRAILDSGPWRTDGVAVLDGLPTDEQAAWQAVQAVSSALGELRPQDAAGSLVRAVRYRGVRLGEGDWARYSDSREGGSLHTDGPHRPGRPPAAFALLCVRQAAAGGHLVLVPTARIVRRLEPSVRDLLQSPFAFDRREPGTTPVLRPILKMSGAGWQLAYLRAYIELGHRHQLMPALTAPQLDALDALDRVVDELAELDVGHLRVKLRPGQLALVDNQRNLHGRTAFGDSADDQDRLMLRTWIDRIERRSPMSPA
jgi:hypothetical protein